MMNYILLACISIAYMKPTSNVWRECDETYESLGFMECRGTSEQWYAFERTVEIERLLVKGDVGGIFLDKAPKLRVIELEEGLTCSSVVGNQLLVTLITLKESIDCPPSSTVEAASSPAESLPAESTQDRSTVIVETTTSRVGHDANVEMSKTAGTTQSTEAPNTAVMYTVIIIIAVIIIAVTIIIFILCVRKRMHARQRGREYIPKAGEMIEMEPCSTQERQATSSQEQQANPLIKLWQSHESLESVELFSVSSPSLPRLSVHLRSKQD